MKPKTKPFTKWMINSLAILLIIAGLLWFLQATYALPSFFSEAAPWTAAFGGAAIAIGAGILDLNNFWKPGKIWIYTLLVLIVFGGIMYDFWRQADPPEIYFWGQIIVGIVFAFGGFLLQLAATKFPKWLIDYGAPKVRRPSKIQRIYVFLGGTFLLLFGGFLCLLNMGNMLANCPPLTGC